ncbi:MAG: BatD family protein, partial [Bacteroidota bacterium]
MVINFKIGFPVRCFIKPSVLSLVIVLFSSWFPIVANSQTLTATVSRNPVGLDEQFQLTFTFTGNLSSFTPPPLNDFMVLSGPNQSNSIQIVNGSYSQSISYSYILQPKKQGTFKIAAANANSGGKNFQSAPISINVTASTNRNQQQSNQNNISSGSVFIRVSLDKRNVYKGEAVVATFKLYTNVQVVNYSITKMPSFTGFWSQDVEMPKQMTLYNENYNGTPYQVGEIKKVVLYPQQSGTLTIDQMIGECIARVKVNRNRSNNPFDIFNDPFFSDPFFGSGSVREVSYSIKSDPVKITVNELPNGAPTGFDGAVGDFSMESIVDRQELKTNDALNVRVKISGNGNLKLIETPFKEIPQEFESYDPKVND